MSNKETKPYVGEDIYEDDEDTNEEMEWLNNGGGGNNSGMLNTMLETKNTFNQGNTSRLAFLNKNKNKQDLAISICSKIPLPHLLQQFSYIIGTNIVFIDYMMFKHFAHSGNYLQIIQYIFANVENLLKRQHQEQQQLQQLQNNTNDETPLPPIQYEIHVNFNSFTVSACHRHLEFLRIFEDYSLQKFLKNVYIYHTPVVIDHILKIASPFINKDVRDLMVFYRKGPESEQKMAELLGK